MSTACSVPAVAQSHGLVFSGWGGAVSLALQVRLTVAPINPLRHGGVGNRQTINPHRLQVIPTIGSKTMVDALNQSDVDALMNAVSAGQVQQEGEAGGGGQAQIFSRFRRDLENIEISEYNFKRPERISKDQMRKLQTLHESFARDFATLLSGFLRTIVDVRIAHAEQMTYSEFIGSLPNPTCFNLIHVDPPAPPSLEGQLCLELSPLIIYPIIDRLLGGSSQESFIPQRAMTLIETRLIQRILKRGMTGLSEVWENMTKVKFSLGEMESNPQAVQIMPPNEVVVVIGFEIRMSNRAGTMSLCAPFNMIEPLMESANHQNWATAGKPGVQQKWEGQISQRQISQRLSDATLEVAGILAETAMTIADLRSLEVGDLIMTEKSAESPAVLTTGGKPKFLAHVGQHRGNRALKIQRPLRPSERA